MDLQRARSSLNSAQLCLQHRFLDSAVSRAYFAIFQMAVCALETRGVKRTEWTHKGVHSEFVQTFVRRRKIVPANFAGALPALMDLRHLADYRQPRLLAGWSRETAQARSESRSESLQVSPYRKGL